jgi:hypothetical protein
MPLCVFIRKVKDILKTLKKYKISLNNYRETNGFPYDPIPSQQKEVLKKPLVSLLFSNIY